MGHTRPNVQRGNIKSLGGPDRALMGEVQLNQTFMRGHCPKERMPERYNLRMLLPRSMFLCTKSGTEDSLQTARAVRYQEKQVFEDVKTRQQDSTIENVMRMDELTRFS